MLLNSFKTIIPIIKWRVDNRSRMLIDDNSYAVIAAFLSVPSHNWLFDSQNLCRFGYFCVSDMFFCLCEHVVQRLLKSDIFIQVLEESACVLACI